MHGKTGLVHVLLVLGFASLAWAQTQRLPPCFMATATCPMNTTGKLEHAGNCAPASPDFGFADLYTLVTSPQTLIEVVVTSTEFAPVLELRLIPEFGRTLLRRDPNIEQENTARITYVSLMGGEHHLTIMPTATNVGGSYELTINCAVGDPGPPQESCSSSETELCLSSGRFSVSLDASDHRTGRGGGGQVVFENEVSGAFSIPALTGDAENPEVFLKILDGRPANGRFWLFFGTLTDMDVVLTVTDHTTGDVKRYRKPARSFCGEFDLRAF
jgi:hypothetical protein